VSGKEISGALFGRGNFPEGDFQREMSGGFVPGGFSRGQLFKKKEMWGCQR